MITLPSNQKLLIINQAAAFLGVSTKTLRRWEKKGVLVPQRTVGNQRRYTIEEITNFKLLSRTRQKAPVQAFHPVKVEPRYAFNPQLLFLGALFGLISAISAYTLVADANFREKLTAIPVFKQEKTKEVSILGFKTAAPDFTFNVNVPANFREKTIFSKDIEVEGKLTAPNIIQSIEGGEGVLVSEGQNPTISNTGVLSLGGSVGKLSLAAGAGISVDGLTVTNSGILALSAGTGISVSGSTITNNDTGSSQNIFKTIAVTDQSDLAADLNADTLTFAAGAGIVLTTTASSDTLTIAGVGADLNVSGWTDDGTVVRLSTSTDKVGIGTTGPSTQLHLTGDLTIGGDDLYMAVNTSGMLLIADGTNFNPVSLSGDVNIDHAGAVTIQVNSVALGTDTTGSYTATIADAGSGHLTVSGSGPENAAVTLSITADSLNFTELADSLSLDALTKINLNSYDFGFYGTGNVGIGTTSPSAKLHVAGNIKVDGSLYVDNASIFTGSYVKLNDDVELQLGSSFDALLVWETNDGAGGFTDYLSMVISASLNWVVSADNNIDWGHSSATNPTLYIQSADETSTAEYLRLYHDGTNAHLGSGAGDIILTPASSFKLSVNSDLEISNSNDLYSYGSQTLGSRVYTEDNYVSDNETFTVSIDVLDQRLAAAISGESGLWLDDTTYIHASNVIANDVVITDSGNVGIGTTSPAAKLHVAGALNVTGSTTFNTVTYAWPGSDAASSGRALTSNSSGTLSWTDLTGSGGGDIGAWTTVGNNLYPDSISYNVGIGNTGPNYKLDITGIGRFTAGGYINNIRIGISGANELDTLSGDLTLDSAGGTITLDDNISVSGSSILAGNVFLDDNLELQFGGGLDSGDVEFLWETADTDNPYFSTALSGSNNWIVSADKGIDWERSANTNPTLYLQSADESSKNNYISFYHDQNNGMITTGAGNLVLFPAGNVGIGTTSPVQKLHVEGQCVTGDTLLPVLRTEVSPEILNSNIETLNKSQIQNSNAPNSLEFRNSDLEFIPIRDVKGGEFVLSLDEETGKIVPAKIKGLLDMGVQPVYKLTTEDGRTIRTTGNHPYLTKLKAQSLKLKATTQNSKLENSKWTKVSELEVGMEIAVLGTTGNGKDQNKAYQGNNQGDNRKDNLAVHLTSLSDEPINYNQNYTASQTGNREKGNPVVFDHDLTPLTKNIPVLKNPTAKEIPQTRESVNSSQFFGRETKGLITPATNQATPILERNSAINLLWPTDNLSTNQKLTQEENDVKFVKIASIELVGEEQVYDIEVEGTHNFVAGHFVRRNPKSQTLNPKQYLNSNDQNSKQGDKESLEHSDLENSNLFRVSSLEFSVSDEEVFFGGIVAHNTYMSGNLGIGTTNPVQKLHVEGQCITGDSLLSVVPTDNNAGQGFTDHSSQFTETQIKDIKPGTEVYSLNEE
ncbi:MerR family DNA-binding transcriptional regulator, partial [Candidatus Shapirobacteria bacterium]|nr:MerR family DNA-binding transcriptional regulator [Candidatus Shapirobacteria bacterium]